MSDPLMTRDELRKAWIEALRSGKYPQGREYLRNSEGNYCCLGVLCEVMGYDHAEEGLGFISSTGRNVQALISHFEKQAVDITQDTVNDLMSMNDSSNWSFSDIADYLEKEVFNDC